MAESAKQPEPNAAQPGEVITPGSTVTASPPPPQPQAAPVPAQTTQPVAPFQAPEPDSQLPPTASQITEDGISWTASEFIAHEKTPKWYLNLTVAALALTLVIYLLTRDIISSAVILFGALMLGIYGARKPRQLPYRLDTAGVQIGEKWHSLQEFRSFAIMPEGAFASIAFIPLKRFAPITSIYYAPEDEDQIVAILSASLPYEERKHDPIDTFMQRIRF